MGVESELLQSLRVGQFEATVDRLLGTADDLEASERQLLEAADRVTTQLAADTAAEGERLRAALARGGISASAAPVPRRKLHVLAELTIDGNADAARHVLEANGYRLLHPMGSGAWAAYRRSHDAAVFSRLEDPTQRAELRWAPASDRHRLIELATPGAADLRLVDLPSWAWPAYWGLRAGRLGWERALNRPRGGGDLGPFLATPHGVARAVLELAEPGADDLVVDLGCGDGRVVIDAARTYGCRARGYERDAELAARARAAVTEAALSDRVQIVQGDALEAELGDATVVFVFLPVDIVVEHLTTLLRRLPAGARLVAHEQQPVAWPALPDTTRLVVTDGVSVGYRWNAGEA